jgi:hypothetical protein
VNNFLIAAGIVLPILPLVVSVYYLYMLPEAWTDAKNWRHKILVVLLVYVGTIYMAISVLFGLRHLFEEDQ